MSLLIVGSCFIGLAAYVAVDLAMMLYQHEAAQRSVVGLVLARAKRRVAAGLGSSAMHADSRQTDFCSYLSAILLCGLALNAAFGWWWADPVAALVMTPGIAGVIDRIRSFPVAARYEDLAARRAATAREFLWAFGPPKAMKARLLTRAARLGMRTASRAAAARERILLPW